MYARMLSLLVFTVIALLLPALALGCAPEKRGPIPLDPVLQAHVQTLVSTGPGSANTRSREVAPVPIRDHETWRDMGLGMRVYRLSGTTCDDTPTPLPPGTPTGGTLWQLCYDVPPHGMDGRDNGDWGDPIPVEPPTTVIFTRRRDPRDASQILGILEAPPDNGRWMASILLHVPEEDRAPLLLNAVNAFRSGEEVSHRRAVDVDARANHVITIGHFQVWRVGPDGSRVLRPTRILAHACVDELSPEFGLERGVSFMPEGTSCPAALVECGDGRYHCPTM